MTASSFEIPQDIAPKAFYEELLPRLFREGRAKAAQAMPSFGQAQFSLAAEVTGEGGGTWTLAFADGNMEVRPTSDPGTLARFVQTREDWQVTITQGVGRLLTKLAGAAPPPPPPTPGSMPRPGLTPQKIDRLKQLKGVMSFDLTGYEGTRTIRLKVVMNDAVENKDPTCTVTMTAADYKDVAAGRLQPQQAFMAGKVKLTGDMGFAMQLMTSLMMP